MSQLCPFCKTENLCSVNTGSCWCMNVQVPHSLIELLPANSLHKECICQRCISLYKNNEQVFKEKFDGKTQ